MVDLSVEMHNADVPVPRLHKNVAEVSTENQIVDVLALQCQEGVEVNMAIPQKRICERIFERILFDPVLQIQE